MKPSCLIKGLFLISVWSVLSGCSCDMYCSRGAPLDHQPAVALRDIHFSFGSAKLTSTAKQRLREDFELLDLGNPSSSTGIILQGRADERGSSQYNLRLSERRVAEVKNYLLELGAPASQFETHEFGESAPLATGSKPEAWARNRSVRVLAR